MQDNTYLQQGSFSNLLQYTTGYKQEFFPWFKSRESIPFWYCSFHLQHGLFTYLPKKQYGDKGTWVPCKLKWTQFSE